MQNNPIIDKMEFVYRRTSLQKAISEPILLMGNTVSARNFPANHLPFRQDSTFWYFSGCTIPGAAILLLNTEHILFLPPQDPNDELWHGSQESNDAVAKSLGFHRYLSIENLDSMIHTLRPNTIHSIAVPSIEVNQWLSNTLNQPFVFGQHNGSNVLIEQIVQRRRKLRSMELEQLRWTSQVTCAAHVKSIHSSELHAPEWTVRSRFLSVLQDAGLEEAYNTICTTNGEILHNHHYNHTLEPGKMLLLDGGAESPYGYATDVTRTWPCSATFSARQRAAYSAVLSAQKIAIDMVKPGVETKDIHLAACLELSKFLVDEGLIHGTPEDAVASGAHAVFFPHGIGHLLGLDVHDMENFGDRATYAQGRKRSDQFGLSYLRMDLPLEADMVITIEPGFYIVPAILDNAEFRKTFQNVIDWSQVEKWRGFGGIRIEDNIVCTKDNGPENLSEAIPKEIDVIEQLRSIVVSD